MRILEKRIEGLSTLSRLWQCVRVTMEKMNEKNEKQNQRGFTKDKYSEPVSHKNVGHAQLAEDMTAFHATNGKKIEARRSCNSNIRKQNPHDGRRIQIGDAPRNGPRGQRSGVILWKSLER